MAEAATIWVDGKPFTRESMTLGEEIRYRHALWELAPGNDLDQIGQPEIIAACVVIAKQREDPDFTVDDLLEMDMKMEDVAKRPPTQRAKPKPKTSS